MIDYVSFPKIPNSMQAFLELVRWGENEIMKNMGIPQEKAQNQGEETDEERQVSTQADV